MSKLKINDGLSENVPFVPVRPDNRRGQFIAVFLSHNDVTGEIDTFRCIKCGNVVFQYGSNVNAIVDGSSIPEKSVPIDIMCNRCKIVYRII